MIIKKNNIQRFLDGPIINFPRNCNALRIDVGLAGEAPNSAKWLLETKNRFVLGVEPIDHHWDMLTEFFSADTDRPYPDFPFIQLSTNAIEYEKKIIGKIDNRFIGIQCALSDVPNLVLKDFYQMDRSQGASGSSSLLKPTNEHPHFVEKIIKTPTVSLSKILDKIDYQGTIEHLKTDCEAHDFAVVKSAGRHLKNICFVTSEMTKNLTHHNGSYTPKDFIQFMLANDFSIIKKRWGVFKVNGGEINFINKKLKKIIKERGYEATTFGL